MERLFAVAGDFLVTLSFLREANSLNLASGLSTGQLMAVTRPVCSPGGYTKKQARLTTVWAYFSCGLLTCELGRSTKDTVVEISRNQCRRLNVLCFQSGSFLPVGRCMFDLRSPSIFS